MDNSSSVFGVGSRWQLLAVALLAIAFLLGGPVRSSQAATVIYVNTFADLKQASDGACSLREAIIAANGDRKSGNRNGECPAGSGADTIILPAGTYLLTRTDNGQEDAAATGDLDILDDLTITGAGAPHTVVAGMGLSDRIFDVIRGSVTITGLTVRDGHVPGSGGGLAIESSLVLADVVVAENQAATAGGGIYVAPTGSLTMTGSTVWGNSAAGAGGGLKVDGQASLTNSTLSQNQSQQSGSGLLNRGSSALQHVTVAANVAAASPTAGLVSNSGALTLANSILADGCAGALHSLGHNLVQYAAGCTIGGVTAGNIIGQDPLLGPLADNGGPTPTHALLAGSPAVEGGAWPGPLAPSATSALTSLRTRLRLAPSCR